MNVHWRLGFQSLLPCCCCLILVLLEPNQAFSERNIQRSVVFLPDRHERYFSYEKKKHNNASRSRYSYRLSATKRKQKIQQYEINANQKIDIGVFSQVGSDPKRPQKVNQDAYFRCSYRGASDEKSSNSAPLFTCAGVLDGHGLKGHLVSQYLAQQLPLQLKNQLEINLQKSLVLVQHSETAATMAVEAANVTVEELEQKLVALGGLSTLEVSCEHQSPISKALVKAFHSVHQAAMQDESIPAGRNGATCVVILLDHIREEIYVANVGDSRAIQIKIALDTKEENNKHSFWVNQLTEETTIKLEQERNRIEHKEGYIVGTKNV